MTMNTGISTSFQIPRSFQQLMSLLTVSNHFLLTLSNPSLGRLCVHNDIRGVGLQLGFFRTYE